MPQLNPGGKFVFGWSVIRKDRTIHLPPLAVKEYRISPEGRVILISGSKKTGGFCVSNKGMLEKSNLRGLFEENPLFAEYRTNECEWIKYKGRLYCWLSVNADGILTIDDTSLKILWLNIGDKLLSIRGSDIAFVMGAKGPLIERAQQYPGEILSF
jgi:hypothetical protein